MKTSAQSLAVAPAAAQSWLAVFGELVKARLTFLVLLTTLVGFYIGARELLDYALLVHTLFGTALMACGASALNQLAEREHDARMRRTESRPLPSGRLQPEAVNLLTSLIGAFTLVTYVFLYTPLKRVTWLNTAVGAVPGALPPLMGWTAARNELTGEGWSLFAILFFWQIPHFLAIAWMYREEYQKAGFVMLPSIDPQGYRTGRQAVSHSLALLFVSLTPFLFRLAGPVYLAGALVLGVVFLAYAGRFSRRLTVPRARQLFLASILYLPLLLGLMVLDKIRN